MKNNVFTIVFSGVGGQGLISALRIIGGALINRQYNVHSSETHGLGQRGGKVKTFLRFGKLENENNNEIAPLPALGTADIIIVTEKSAILDVLEFAKPDKSTIIVIDSYKNEIVGVDYPEDEYINKCLAENTNSEYIHFIPATDIAEKKVKNIKTANTILIGFILKFLPISDDELKKSLNETFPGKVAELNIKALEEGINYE
ncbi:MAG: 2-oxoacid:acceptor oxidoreductase family protein [Promethearchaeota archaeon]